MDWSGVKIETGRLRLVPVSRRYAEPIFREYREPVTTYMNHPSPGSLETLRERLAQREREIAEGKVLFLAVHRKDTDEFLGCFSLESLAGGTPEMGGWLKKSAHGKHFGREAAAAIRQWADEHLEYQYLVWPCAAENIASRKLAESLGGTVRKEYEKTNAGGRVWAYVEYGIPRGR